MKKVILGCLLLILASCGKKEIIVSDLSYEGESNIPQISNINNLNELDYLPYLIEDRLNNIKSYTKETTGSTKAKLIFQFTQNLTSTTSRYNDYYSFESNSNSTLVNSYHKMLEHGKEIKYKENKNDEYTLIDQDSYIKSFGIVPSTNPLEGLILSKESIKEVTLIEENDNKEYKILFDNEYATVNIKKQMIKFGGLKSSPVFSEIYVTYQIKDDFTPLSLSFHSSYTVDFGGFKNVKCTQNYSSTFNYDVDTSNLIEQF